MSPSVSSRPLSLLPFLAADGVLLLTAFLIGWTSDDLTGGALLGVVVCTGLGAVLLVLPYVLNDARERETALAERQRELVDLVNSSTSTASRWGTQWAAAATGLDDAAGLAARNIAAAERLPAIFQEQIDTFTDRLDQAELSARARDERSTCQEDVLATRAEHAAGITAALERTLAGFGRMEADLRERHTELEITLAEIPAATARALLVRNAVDERISAVPAQLEAHVARLTSETEARLAASTNALALQLGELETRLGALTEQLERVKKLDVPASTPVMAETIAPILTLAPIHPHPSAPETVNEAPVVVAHETTVMSVCETNISESDGPPPLREETIMDPFYIPSDGYSALADAMDKYRSP